MSRWPTFLLRHVLIAMALLSDRALCARSLSADAIEGATNAQKKHQGGGSPLFRGFRGHDLVYGFDILHRWGYMGQDKEYKGRGKKDKRSDRRRKADQQGETPQQQPRLGPDPHQQYYGHPVYPGYAAHPGYYHPGYYPPQHGQPPGAGGYYPPQHGQPPGAGGYYPPQPGQPPDAGGNYYYPQAGLPPADDFPSWLAVPDLEVSAKDRPILKKMMEEEGVDSKADLIALAKSNWKPKQSRIYKKKMSGMGKVKFEAWFAQLKEETPEAESENAASQRGNGNSSSESGSGTSEDLGQAQNENLLPVWLANSGLVLKPRDVPVALELLENEGVENMADLLDLASPASDWKPKKSKIFRKKMSSLGKVKFERWFSQLSMPNATQAP